MNRLIVVNVNRLAALLTAFLVFFVLLNIKRQSSSGRRRELCLKCLLASDNFDRIFIVGNMIALKFFYDQLCKIFADWMSLALRIINHELRAENGAVKLPAVAQLTAVLHVVVLLTGAYLMCFFLSPKL